MKAEIIALRSGDRVVTVTGKGDPSNCTGETETLLITINGFQAQSVAEGIKRMIDQDQCPACGKFNGLHGETYNVTSMDNGEVRGHHEICAMGKK
jgi:hypothetical protein